jgi:2-iminoacetate synthase
MIKRRTLTEEEVLKEAEALYLQGFRHVLLVSGEDRQKVSAEFMAGIVRKLSREFAGISIEVYPLKRDEYRMLAGCGVTGIALYQETYNRSVYETVHDGPKADFNARLSTLENAGEAGFREIGIGALLGLSDFAVEMYCVGLHAGYLMKRFWKAAVSISFPRLREAKGAFKPYVVVADRQLAQAVFAFRMVLPDAELVLSTRESPEFRNGMAGIGITRMSAGSRTNPGGYGVSNDSLEQFEISDKRSPEKVAAMLQAKDMEPVWKDFDRSFLFDPGE